MSVYFDSSALAKRYVLEQESDQARSLFETCNEPTISAIAIIEVRRIVGRFTGPMERVTAQALFNRDLELMSIIDVTPVIVETAAEIAATSQLRTLDSIHLASAMAAECTRIVTFDKRQAQVARSLGILPMFPTHT